MIITMGLVATICGVLIVGAFQGTQDAIAENKRITLERAVFKVLPGAASVREYAATPAGIQPLTGVMPEGGVKFYAAYDKEGVLKGIAAEAAGKGYADTVARAVRLRRHVPVHRRHRCRVHARDAGHRRQDHHRPGVLKNFEALDVRVNAEMTALANAVKVVKHGTKKNAWEIDAIAGATVTSKAVGRGISESAQKLLPKLVPHIAELKP